MNSRNLIVKRLTGTRLTSVARIEKRSFKFYAQYPHLLEKEADVNAKDDKENTPLHLATEKGHKEIVKILLEKRSGC